MSATRIANRYAKSLIDLSIEQGKLEESLRDVNLFSEALKNRDLELLIKSPIIHADKKLSIFNAIFGGKLNELTSSFFNIIIKKGRESYLPDIARSFQDQYKRIKNITPAVVTTAAAMSSQQIQDIKAEISKLGLASGDIELTTKVDPTIIGGFVLEVNDKLYDASVKKKLADVKKEILDNTYIKSL